MAFPNATGFQIDRSTFNDVQGNYNQHIQGDFNQKINVHGAQDVPNRIYSAMKDHIYTAAYYNSGVRREISRCYPGTRETALETISNWIKNPTSHCLWLRGPAGTGKSSITYTVAEKCHSDGTLGATYFFTRSSTDNLKRPPFFSTLAYQLALAIPDLRDPLWAMLCEDPTVFDRPMSEQLDKLIVQPFLRLAHRPAHVVIVIDGLDECDCAGGAAIQADIVQLVLGLGEHSLPLRFVISSRPEPEIRHAFESPPRSLVELTHLSLDKTLLPDRDIRHFLCKEFERVYRERVEDGIPQVASQTTWPPPEAIERIVEESSGHFIYASTVVKFVQEENANPMERLDAVLHISNESAGPSAFVQSASFRELDQLYLHILRRAGDPAVLRRILRAIVYFPTYGTSVDNLDIIFSRTGGVRFLLRGLRSIIEVTDESMVRFFHASLSDFLMDPARSREFHYDLSQFQADLACECTRLIALFSPIESGGPLTIAMPELKNCLQGIHAHPELFSATLEKLDIVITQRPKSPSPQLCYSGLEYLFYTLKKVPGTSGLRNKLKTARWRLEPQLAKLSGSTFTFVRFLGAMHSAMDSGMSPSPADILRMIDMPDGPEIIQEVLGPNYKHTYSRNLGSFPMRQVRRSLLEWLFAHRRRKWLWGFIAPAVQGILRPQPQITMENYTWERLWDTTAFLPSRDLDTDASTLHQLDLIYCCFRTLFRGIIQSSNYAPGGKELQLALEFVGNCIRCMEPGLKKSCWVLNFDAIRRVLDGIDFTPISRALLTLSTEFYPRLFYLLRLFDGGPTRLTNGNLSLRHCIRDIYSHLMQDLTVSRAVLFRCSMFKRLSVEDMELLLGLAPGELFHSPVMQALFRVGDGIYSELSTWLPLLLKNGSVKLQHDVSNNYDINDYIYNAHEYLAFTCIEYVLLHAHPQITDMTDVGWYAMKYWASHLRHAKHSERLFEALRRVAIERDDIERVIESLEKSADTPEDVLLRWHAARLKHNTKGLSFPDHKSMFDECLEED